MTGEQKAETGRLFSFGNNADPSPEVQRELPRPSVGTIVY